MELITVIAIITILMSLLFPVLAMARETNRRNKATMVAKLVVQGCNAYANDYGKYPPIPDAMINGTENGNAYYAYGDTQNGKCKVPNSQLFDVLRAIPRAPNEGNTLNKRGQSYFEERESIDSANPREGFADGKTFPSQLQGQLLDPWGRQYCIVLDADSDGLLKLDSFFRDLTDPIRQSAIVFSMAKNQEIGGQGFPGRLQKESSNEPIDYIVSWK